MKTLTILTVLLSLTACGKAYQAPEVAEFVQEFESTYNMSVGNIPITMSDDMPLTIYGKCVMSSTQRVIAINSYLWPRLPEERRKALIFHELGHCVLMRGHDDRVYEQDGCPKSIMSSALMAAACIDRHKVELIAELVK